MSDRNGTRWSSSNWLNADLARITDVSRPLPVNHMTDRVNAYQAFAAWLDKTVTPETFDWIMANENAFATSYSAYRHLAQFEARMKTNTNTNTTINREGNGPAESNNQ